MATTTPRAGVTAPRRDPTLWSPWFWLLAPYGVLLLGFLVLGALVWSGVIHRGPPPAPPQAVLLGARVSTTAPVPTSPREGKEALRQRLDKVGYRLQQLAQERQQIQAVVDHLLQEGKGVDVTVLRNMLATLNAEEARLRTEQLDLTASLRRLEQQLGASD